jgi:hypothetical protein
MFRLSLNILLVLSMVGLLGHDAVKLIPGGAHFNPAAKDASDGRLEDWGNGKPMDPLHYTHLHANEAQYIENTKGYIFGKPPVGGPDDEPLSEEVVMYPPMGSGFNLVSGLVSFDPTFHGGVYWLAMDLPGPTNDLVSEGFFNEFFYDTQGITLYPIPFDVDCNSDRTTIDYPGSLSYPIDDQALEYYEIRLWVGGDETQGWNVKTSQAVAPEIPENAEFNDTSYHGPGFPVVVTWTENVNGSVPYHWEAVIPKQYLKDSTQDLILGDSAGGGLDLITQSDPGTAMKPAYDIEVEIRGILTEIFPLIDLDKVGYPAHDPMTIWDCYHCFVKMVCDSTGDLSSAEVICLGLNVRK